MAVIRIVPNIAVASVEQVQKFYADLFDLDVVMDHGWIVTLATEQMSATQISFASQGGSDTPVPDLSIEVDDVDAVYERAVAKGHQIAYALTDEPWGVRRFYLTDPVGKLLNVLSHV